ncbi:MAG: flagellar basal body rod protein FlgB [Pikeienuella sp.]
MLENLTIVAKASAMARHAAARHKLLAENVANADTPGFRARDLRPFAEMVNAAEVKEGFRLRATRPGHRLGPLDGQPFRPILSATPPSPNGNSVDLADQSRRAAENQGQHALALAIYAKAADLWRIGLGRNR